MTALNCDHCLLSFPEREAVYDDIDGTRHVFCCHGCNGVYRLIHEEGLDKFYEKRKWDETGVPSSLFNKDIDVKPFAEHVRDVEGNRHVSADSGQKEEKAGHVPLMEIDLLIDGIRCASCVWLNEKILSRTEGVDYARVNYATHRARIRWNPEITGLDKILRRILSIGYNPKPYIESEQFSRRRSETRDLLVRFGTAGFLSSQLMIYSTALYAGYFQGIDATMKLLLEIIAMVLTVPVLLYSGMPFISGTIRGLRHLNFNMDSLITIGAGSAFIFSVFQMFRGGEVYFDTAAMIITLILLGRYIEATAKGKASETIERLAELMPKEARVVGNKQDALQCDEMRPVSSIKKGDFIQVRPGERIPLDGNVFEGESEVDESVITGESRPVAKTAGAVVIGGTMNLYGAFIFEVAKPLRETVLAGIIRAVEDAQARKPKIQTIADRIVGVFVPAIIVTAFLTTVFYLMRGVPPHLALMTGISVLVIACPCSLGLATPLAVLVFTSMASSRGILVRGGEVIENAGTLDHIVFDKTGTVTLGKPVLKETIQVDKSCSGDYLLSVAASIENISEHSLGHAVAEASRGLELFTVSGFRALPGKGVEGTTDGKSVVIGNRHLMKERGVSHSELTAFDEMALQFENNGDTVIFMAWDNAVKALFVISDIIRPEAPGVIKELLSSGLKVSLVSGDNARTTDSIGSVVGIGDALSETSPLEKKEIINEMQQNGLKVMMVGDGINDAPALTAALVGVAMGRGTDIAMESADIVLVRNDLGLIPYFLRVSKRTYRIIKQNIFWAFFYNIVAIPLAVSGILHPIVAAGAMAASSLFVVLNSLRIREK